MNQSTKGRPVLCRPVTKTIRLDIVYRDGEQIGELAGQLEFDIETHEPYEEQECRRMTGDELKVAQLISRCQGMLQDSKTVMRLIHDNGHSDCVAEQRLFLENKGRVEVLEVILDQLLR
jgi:hypothetical protein